MQFAAILLGALGYRTTHSIQTEEFLNSKMQIAQKKKKKKKRKKKEKRNWFLSPAKHLAR